MIQLWDDNTTDTNTTNTTALSGYYNITLVRRTECVDLRSNVTINKVMCGAKTNLSPVDDTEHECARG